MIFDVFAKIVESKLPKLFDLFNQASIFTFDITNFTPAKDIASAQQVKKVRDFAKKWNLRFYDAGCGVEHVLLPEEGLVLPQDIIIGADSHTCTYGALGAFAARCGPWTGPAS